VKNSSDIWLVMLMRYRQIELPAPLRRFLVFCGVGVFNTLIGFLFILFFNKILGFYYLIANFLGYFVSVIIGYVTHKNITFRDAASPITQISDFIKHFRKFSMVFTVSYIVQLVSLFIMVDYMEFWFIPAQMIAILVYILSSYVGNCLIIFRKPN
jgi:putative flippase GtrA